MKNQLLPFVSWIPEMNCSKSIDICVDRWLWFHVIPLTILRKIFPPSSPSNCFLSKSVPCNSIHCGRGDFARTSKSWRDTPPMLASYPPGWRRIHVFFGWGFLETLTFATGILGGVFSPPKIFICSARDFFHDGTVGNKKNRECARCQLDIPSSLQISRKNVQMKLPVRKRWGTHFDNLEVCALFFEPFGALLGEGHHFISRFTYIELFLKQVSLPKYAWNLWREASLNKNNINTIDSSAESSFFKFHVKHQGCV